MCGFTDWRDLQRAHRQWVEQALEDGLASRDDRWSESIAVGTLDFVEKIKTELGMKAMRRNFEPAGEAYALREPSEAYAGGFSGRNEVLKSEIPSRGMKASKTQVDNVVRPRNTTCNSTSYDGREPSFRTITRTPTPPTGGGILFWTTDRARISRRDPVVFAQPNHRKRFLSLSSDSRRKPC